MLNGGDTNEGRAARQNLAWGLCQADADGNYSMRSDLPDEGIEGGNIGGPLNPEACRSIFTGDGVKHETSFTFSLPFSDKVSPDTTVSEYEEVQFAVVGDRALLMDPDNGLSESPQAYGFVANSAGTDRKSTRLNSSHVAISYAVFCLKNRDRSKK